MNRAAIVVWVLSSEHRGSVGVVYATDTGALDRWTFSGWRRVGDPVGNAHGGQHRSKQATEQKHQWTARFNVLFMSTLKVKKKKKKVEVTSLQGSK